MSSAEIIILCVVTIALAVFNWEFSVKAGRFHGIYRFFSFEAISILVLLNWRFWILDPFSWNQIISWILLIGSIPVAEEGFRLLRNLGRAAGQFENTTTIVSAGIYKYIRHPLYASLILVGFGICFKQVSLVTVALAVINLVAMIATAVREEKEMLGVFGDEYDRYRGHTKMFIPYIM